MRNTKGQFVKIKPSDRFWDKVKKTKTCWLWIGTIRPTDGYGTLSIDGRKVRSHRISWEMKNGSIPSNMVICHKCDTPRCIRPSHLFLGTQAENLLDMRNKNRNSFAFKGSKHPNAKFSDVDINAIRGLYLTTNKTQKEIGKMFNASQQSIHRIVLRKRYV